MTETPEHISRRQTLLTELQTQGLRIPRNNLEHVSRRGGAGPSDHQAVEIDGHTVMVPIYTHASLDSTFSLAQSDAGATLLSEGIPLKDITLTETPQFYALTTADGIPYSHIATLHGKDVLATTVLQTCVRYESRRKACKFCSIGQSLRAGRTIERKTPQQLAEVAKAAVELDGITHMVMTTGTPPGRDRGAAILCESVAGVKAAVDLPIQVQCEPPSDPIWYQRMKTAGADALGMHLEVITPALRTELMPGKSEIDIEAYLVAFEQAVSVFGRGQVSTYILAGLGDEPHAILALSEKLITLGVYPFVVPFVPITGTPLEDHPAPSASFMESILKPLAAKLKQGAMRSADIKAGCGKCGACSTLAAYEFAEDAGESPNH